MSYMRRLRVPTGAVLRRRCFTVGVPSAVLPRGMHAFQLRDSADTVEALAEAYVSMNLATMRTFHEIVVKGTACPHGTTPPSYEEMLLQGMGSGSSHIGSVSSSSNGVVGASAAPSAPSAAAAAEAAPAKKAAEKHAFDVTVRKYPAANKVKLIKELRAVSGLPLQEAKAAVEKCPGIVAKAMPRADAEKLKKLFEGHGAEVELA
ncbi:ribosomal protein L7/L12 [Trypanosoma grayi]|uniref:ribosomal protein L7/L12 n=1 Tax=Trypanosoma grayi TaxID=71804 RepID=UPI0004F4B89C|nr:ribosomal protein L7/L12 [Trypanosoma grayi]KEG06248.1 ribosomal protein L7/L12 [Trypanosoma grayi]